MGTERVPKGPQLSVTADGEDRRRGWTPRENRGRADLCVLLPVDPGSGQDSSVEEHPGGERELTWHHWDEAPPLTFDRAWTRSSVTSRA